MRRRRTGLVLVVAALAALTGCASAEPLADLGPVPGDAPDPAPHVETLVTALTEVYAHGLDAPGTPTTIVSDGATTDVAVAELAEALPLGPAAQGFLAATSAELTRSAAAGGAEGVEEVVVEPGAPELVGEHDGDPVATVAVTVSVLREAGPTTEERADYALVLDGDTLAAVLAWRPGVDSGVGLRSPTGAVARLLDLVRADDVEAARFFSGGVSTDAELRVLAGLLDDVERLVELPQARMGSATVVYALDDRARVLGRFEVLLGAETSVVYAPTS